MFLFVSFALIGLAHSAEDVFQFPASAKEPELLTLSRNLKNLDVIRGQFNQTKHVKLLTRPLVSRGNFLFAKDKGLYWQVLAPIPVAIVFTRQGMFEQSDDKGFVSVVARNKPLDFGFANVLFALFSGDLKILSQYFEVYFSGNSETWTVGLKPQRGVLQKLINNIVLKGNRAINRIVIHESGENLTEIIFSNTEFDPELSEKELSYFSLHRQ